MKLLKNMITFSLLAMLFVACEEGDYDDLQKQIDELNDKIEQSEQAQNDELLAEIAKLEATLDSIGGNYDDLLDELEELEGKIDDNSSDVYYGNLLTDEDYTAFSESGASIVSGKVVITKTGQVAILDNLEMVGTNLMISCGGDINLSNLKNVSGTFSIVDVNEEDLTIVLPLLASVGGDFSLIDNSGLKSVDLPNLVFIDGKIYAEGNAEMHTFSLAKLDVVSDDIYFVNMDDLDRSKMSNFDLSYANVKGDVTINNLGNADMTDEELPSIYLGEVEDLSLISNIINTIDYSGEVVGTIEMLENMSIAHLEFTNLKTIDGSFIFEGNNAGTGFGAGGPSQSDVTLDLEGFGALTFINGNVSITNNYFASIIEGFNKVERIGGNSIIVKFNKDDAEAISIFNELLEPEGEGTASYYIEFLVNSKWTSSFNSIKVISDLYVVQGNYSATVCELEGFDKLEEIQEKFRLYVPELTAFEALSQLDRFNSSISNFEIQMPADPLVTFCSMSNFLTKMLNGDFDNEDDESIQPNFYTAEGNVVTKEEAIPILLTNCN